MAGQSFPRRLSRYYSAAVQDGPTPVAKRGALRWRPYAVAIVLTLTALVVRMAVAQWVGSRPLLLLFVIPMAISAYLGGLGPGLFATFLCGLVVDWFVLPPAGTFGFSQPIDFAQWSFMV